MAQFLKTADINEKMLYIIHSARRSLVLVSPFLKLLPEWESALHAAAGRGVSIKVIYGKKKQQSGAITSLEQIPGLSLYFMKQLHAKCYFNEQLMIIGSMNLFDYSSKNNKEMGVLLHRLADKEAFDEAVTETKKFIRSAQQEMLFASRLTAFCIRCATSVLPNPLSPFCAGCYERIIPIAAPHFLAGHCHTCGKTHATSLWYPNCPVCTRQQLASPARAAIR